MCRANASPAPALDPAPSVRARPSAAWRRRCPASAWYRRPAPARGTAAAHPPPLRFERALLLRQERHMPASRRQALEIVDEGAVGGRMIFGIVGRGTLFGADFGQPLLVHRLRDRLKLAFGHAATGANTVVQHGHHPIIGRGQDRAPVTRLRPVGGSERQADINGLRMERIVNPAPPEDVAAAENMLKRRQGRPSRTATWHSDLHIGASPDRVSQRVQ